MHFRGTIKNKTPLGFIAKIISAIVIGGMVGQLLTYNMFGIFVLKLLVTFSDLFSQFLSFFVPIVVLGLIIPSIMELGEKASKMLMIAVVLAYISLLSIGMICLILGYSFVPIIFTHFFTVSLSEAIAYKGFLPTLITPFFDVVTAIVLAFTFGLAAAVVKVDSFSKITKDVEKLIYFILNRFIIRILPIYIACIFAKLSARGELQANLLNFALIIVAIFIVSNTWTILLMFITSIFSRKSFFLIFKSYLPAYLVAFGTQSSKATIPVSLECAEKIGISKEIREFSIPLLATIHLIGSMVTQTLGSIAIYYIFVGSMIPLTLMFSYIFVLATILLAAPGIPGGEPVATKPLLVTYLKFPPGVAEIMFTFGVANDSFSTAVNVTTDNSIILILDGIHKRLINKKTQ